MAFHKNSAGQFEMDEAVLHQLDDNSEGICLACGETISECEPDARKRRCEACDERRGYGAMEALIMGKIVFVEGASDTGEEA